MKTRFVLIAVVALFVLLMLAPLLMQNADAPTLDVDVDKPASAWVSAAQGDYGVLWFRSFRPRFYGFSAFG